MEPALPTARPPLEIACDESGYEGENLIGGTTDVFAHAGVRLDGEAATACLREIHRRIRSPVREYKSTHLLREKHRPVLEWFLGPSGLLHGDAHVQLTDKTFFVVATLVDLLAPRPAVPAGAGPARDPRSREMAATLYRQGPATFGAARWQRFLASFTDVLRPRNRHGPETPVETFFGMVDDLRRASPPGPVAELLGLLCQARPRALALRALLDDPSTIPALDLLFPAIVGAVAWWGRDAAPVAIVHDEHSTLTTRRIARLQRLPEVGGRLASLRRVDSRADARVQVADFLAGVARKIASDARNGHGDAELTALLRPYVDARSIWGEARSWALLRPAAEWR
ncbi:MAG TPA: hypothetical protein VGC06_22740 [Actinomycetes bacterium]